VRAFPLKIIAGNAGRKGLLSSEQCRFAFKRRPRKADGFAAYPGSTRGKLLLACSYIWSYNSGVVVERSLFVQPLAKDAMPGDSDAVPPLKFEWDPVKNRRNIHNTASISPMQKRCFADSSS
jgi:hypothetical protein